MRIDTLRFNAFRGAAFVAVLAAAAFGGRASAAEPDPLAMELAAVDAASLSAEAAASMHADLARELKQAAEARFLTATVPSLAALDPRIQLDLISKTAAAAASAPRGFGFVVPVILIDPAQ